MFVILWLSNPPWARVNKLKRKPTLHFRPWHSISFAQKIKHFV